jgi:hypothetical protein
MAKGKWNTRLIKRIWIVYWMLFIIYLFFTRSPGFFSGKTTEGVVVDINEQTYSDGQTEGTRRNPVIHFYVDSVERSWYDANKIFLSQYAIGDKVTMIYNPEDPGEACMFGLLGYWLNLTELFTAFLIIIIITAFITVIPYGYDSRYTSTIND